MKRSKHKHSLASVLIILMAGIVIICIYLLLKNKSTIFTQTTNTPPSSTTILPEESIKDGVYTNTKYGFTFKYPNNTFSHTVLNTYVTSENFYRQFFVNENGLSDSLSISVNIDSDSIANYKKYQKLPLNTQYPSLSSYINQPKNTWPGSILLKTKNLKLDNKYSGFVITGYPSGGGISEGEEYYQASWEIQNKIYTIVILTSGKNSLNKYTVVFNNIIDSFHLLSQNN